MTSTPHDVKDLSLAPAGQARIDWAELSPRQQEYLASWTHGT